MSATFDIGEHRAKSFVCALALAAASFSILPLSICVSSKKPGSGAPVLVYRARPDSEISEKTSRENSAQTSLSAPRMPDSRPASARIAPDFSAVKIALPTFAANADFSLESFGAPAADFGAGTIAVFELSELDKIPRRLSGAPAKYPPMLLKRGVEGEVRLNVIIDETGAVEVHSVESSTDPRFEASALAAAEKLKYEVPTRAGKPVRARFTLPMPFRINK
ncbi:MAG: energy transducer TonB [Opitutales bacterium]|nr:energy transducer TonB [Opitutales bacterium]